MTEEISINIESVGVEKLVARFDGYVGMLRPQLMTTMQTIVLFLAAYCKENKLSGQVLHRRSGTLSRSIKGAVTQTAGSIVGDVASRDKGNAPLAYAAFWEYGFSGVENVREHVRKIASGPFEGELTPVRAHVRNVNQAARPYMRPTRDENVGYVQEQLLATLKAVNNDI